MTPYPIHEIAKALHQAGWTGRRARRGWLFHAHIAAEGGGEHAVAGELERMLQLPHNQVDVAAGVISSYVDNNGAVPRRDLKVAEITIEQLIQKVERELNAAAEDYSKNAWDRAMTRGAAIEHRGNT